MKLEHTASITNDQCTVIISQMQDISQGLIDKLGRADMLRVINSRKQFRPEDR